VKLRIAFFGSSLVSAYWNGAATYYRGIIRALHARGHRVCFYEPDAYGRQQHRDIEDPEWARVVVYDAGDDSGVLQCLEAAADADVVVKASGVGVFDQLLEREVLSLRSPSRQVIFWDVDAPATLERVAQNPDDPFRSLLGQYDAVLTYGGGPPVVAAYESLGARRCVPIYNALDPDTHHPVDPDPRFDCTLAFLGNRLPDREARVREFFLEPARALARHTFLLGGSGWEQNLDRPANVQLLGHVFTADHNALNCTPRAVMNISRDSMARFGFSPATRVFEAAGAGACIVSDAWEGMEMFLEPGREILTANGAGDVVECVGALTPQRARRIGAAAYRRVLAEHTYAHRALEVEAHLTGGRAGGAISRPASALEAQGGVG